MADGEYSQIWLAALALLAIFGNGLLVALVGVPNLATISTASIGALILNLLLFAAGLAVFPKGKFDVKDADDDGAIAVSAALLIVGLVGVLSVFGYAGLITGWLPVWVAPLLALAGFVLVNLYWIEEGAARVGVKV